MRVNTEQFGLLHLSWRHDVGDANIAMRRILASQHQKFSEKLIEGMDKKDRKDYIESLVESDLDVLARIENSGLVRVYVDVERMTTCTIIPGIDNDKLPQDFKAYGYSYVNPVDRYNKEEGRERSLKRAISYLPDVTEKTYREIMQGYYSR